MTPQQRYYKRNKELCRARSRESMRKRREADPEASREVGRQWRANNLEHARELDRANYRRNAPKKRAAAKRRRESNPEKNRNDARAWRETHPEQAKSAIARWRRTHPEQVRALNRAYRARKHSANGYASAEAIEARVNRYGGRCAYCEEGLFEAIDHAIPLSRGGTHWPSNLYPACTSCNSTKRDRTPAEFAEYRRKRGTTRVP